jgi:hypothetical protein
MKDAGLQKILPKPFSVETLARAVNEVVTG